MPIEVQNPFVLPDTEDIIHHPDWPDPIPPFMKGRITEVQYVDEEGNVKTILGFTPDDSQLFRIWEEQKELRTRKLEKMLCYYRKELREERCPQDEKSN
jgi:hypothetical protein